MNIKHTLLNCVLISTLTLEAAQTKSHFRFPKPTKAFWIVAPIATAATITAIAFMYRYWLRNFKPTYGLLNCDGKAVFRHATPQAPDHDNAISLILWPHFNECSGCSDHWKFYNSMSGGFYNHTLGLSNNERRADAQKRWARTVNEGIRNRRGVLPVIQDYVTARPQLTEPTVLCLRQAIIDLRALLIPCYDTLYVDETVEKLKENFKHRQYQKELQEFAGDKNFVWCNAPCCAAPVPPALRTRSAIQEA